MTVLDRRAFVAAGGAGLLASCMNAAAPLPASGAPLRIPPLLLGDNRLMRITVCLRPFRPQGPRLEAESFGEKLVVHNYGHGGSGWSLSWGCAEEARNLALASGQRHFAVIGAGVIGLTTALRLIETGAEVTIYAAEFPAETRSARATGVWSPSSRIGFADAVDASFAERWEGWARKAHSVHQSMIGLVGDPVEYLPGYDLADPERTPGVPAAHQWLHLGRRLRGLTPGFRRLDASEHSFTGRNASSGQAMTFNVASYADRLARLFMLRGGKMVRRSLPDRASVLALDEPVVANCMGYGAKQIWNDASLIPVRGQINWFVPQAEARYALYYHQAYAVSRRDGVVVQFLGDNDDWGYGVENEVADREELQRAQAALAPVFE